MTPAIRRTPLRLLAVALLSFSLAPVSAPIRPAAAVTQASPAAGAWKGGLTFAGRTMPMEFSFSQGTDGNWSGTLMVVGQSPAPMPFSRVTLDGLHLVAEASSAHATYDGQLGVDGKTLNGQWKQGGLSLALNMTHQETASAPPRRPQDPQPPFPYAEEQVSYVNPHGNIQLAGTLTLPRTPGKHPAVLLITGSGAQDRDETLMGHRPFRLIADELTRRGIAVLRVDDRGVGGSTGSVQESTSADFAQDVKAGLRFLKGRPEIDPTRLGLVGHSEGGLIAPMAAADNPDVAFVALLAGPGLRGDATIQLQSEGLMRQKGLSGEALEKAQQVQRQVLAIAAGPTPHDQAASQIRAMLYAQLPAGDTPELQAQRKQMDIQIEAMLSPWYRYYLTADPIAYLRKVKCPVLALNGENDTQVLYRQNLGPIEQALKTSGNRNVTIRSFPKLNHLFQTSQTGLVDEYATIEETFAPVALKALGDWLAQHARL